MTTKVAVIGAGPAGLLAAWGAIQEPDVRVTLFDHQPDFRPERIFSLQYLHSPVNLTFAVRRLRLYYRAIWPPDKQSAREQVESEARYLYNYKLGRPTNEANSTRFLWESPVDVWSLRDAYRFLTGHFKDRVIRASLTWDEILELKGPYDLVISTAPLDKLFPGRVWPARVSHITMNYSPVPSHEENACYYNLDPQSIWTRATRLDGGTATEWSSDPGYANGRETRPLRKVVKAEWYPNLPPGFILAGRWGSWDPRQLTHHAFYKARDAVWQLQNGTFKQQVKDIAGIDLDRPSAR